MAVSRTEGDRPSGTKSRKIVVKFGGEVVEPDASGARSSELGALCADVRTLVEAGHRVALVHGGGRQMTELATRLGIATRIVGGRRITDAETLDVLKMTVAGKLSVDLCGAMLAHGVKAVGLHGASAGVIRASRRPPRVISGAPETQGQPVDLGFVGDITGFDLSLIELLQGQQYVPTLACVGADEKGQALNINADGVASQLAVALAADQLLLVTTVSGVLADVADPRTRIARLTRSEGRAAIADGRVRGGMIPKLEEAFLALDRGVGEVHILGHLSPGDLHRASDSPGSVGTALLA